MEKKKEKRTYFCFLETQMTHLKVWRVNLSFSILKNSSMKTKKKRQS